MAAKAPTQNTSTTDNNPIPLKRGCYASVTTLAEALEMSKTTIWRLARQGKFPPPVKFGEQMTRWKTDDVLEWIESKEVAA